MKTWLSSGKVLTTKSGMVTTPCPKWGPEDTNRKVINTNKKVSAWIKQNAIRDAELRGHHHLVFMWQNEKDPIRECVQNDMADYLFHWEPSEIPRDTTMDFLKPFNPPNPQDQRAGASPAPMHPVVGRTLPEQGHV